MSKYDYSKAMINDVCQWVNENMTAAQLQEMGRDRTEEYLNDTLFTEDSITGNASGSYTFSTYQAEENIAHNWDLLQAAADSFGIDPVIKDGYQNGPEYWDVTIRCYLLPGIVAAVVTAMDRAGRFDS